MNDDTRNDLHLCEEQLSRKGPYSNEAVTDDERLDLQIGIIEGLPTKPSTSFSVTKSNLKCCQLQNLN